VKSSLATKVSFMGLGLLSMTIFWTWNAFQPSLQPTPVTVAVPSKIILQANWVEPDSLRDDARPTTLRRTASKKWPAFMKSNPTSAPLQPKKPLWQAAKSWELPPILWASFEGFLAAGLGIASLLKR